MDKQIQLTSCASYPVYCLECSCNVSLMTWTHSLWHFSPVVAWLSPGWCLKVNERTGNVLDLILKYRCNFKLGWWQKRGTMSILFFFELTVTDFIATNWNAKNKKKNFMFTCYTLTLSMQTFDQSDEALAFEGHCFADMVVEEGENSEEHF